MSCLRQKWARKLEEANRELEAFSYSVSHDLRAPIRSIEGFSKALFEEYGEGLEAEGRDYLDRIRAATRRMSQLIDDLLGLSRINRAPLQRQQMDISNLAQKIISEIRERQGERAVSINIERGLTAEVDPGLQALLENLLGNAWKFTAKRPQGRIDVGQEQHGEEIVFFVRDNGAGFDMAYAKMLFSPFQRFDSEAEFEGTGIGLATVQRIVSRHGGRVWADAAADRGATFFFTLS
jgi:light-regulated signal transduction histidine kinase (bacteriophytochrome)